MEGERYSDIAAICTDGILHVYITDEAVNSEAFCANVCSLTFHHIIDLRSVVIMDNASIHHMDTVVSLIEQGGVLVRYLPSYSPDS